MATDNDTPVVDNDKDVLMEVRGIIDGCIESGSTEYAKALQDILIKVQGYGNYSWGVLTNKIPGGLTASL